MRVDFRERASKTAVSLDEARSLLALFGSDERPTGASTLGEISEWTGTDPVQLDAILAEMRANKSRRKRAVLVSAGLAAAFAIGAALAAGLIFGNPNLDPRGDPGYPDDLILMEADSDGGGVE